jgi:hypothetical protein
MTASSRQGRRRDDGDLDPYTAQSIAELENGYLCLCRAAGRRLLRRRSGVFDLLKLRGAGKAVDSQSGLQRPHDGAQYSARRDRRRTAVVGVYATTSRRRVDDSRRATSHLGGFVQVARQGNPLFNEGLVAIKDKDLYSRTSPALDSILFRKYAVTPELAPSSTRSSSDRTWPRRQIALTSRASSSPI